MTMVSGKVTGSGGYSLSSVRRDTQPIGARATGKGKGTVTLTADELDRIRSQVGTSLVTNKEEYNMMRTHERRTLQGVSKSRVQNWPNTLEAQRLRREDDRIRKLEDEEVSISNNSYLLTDQTTRDRPSRRRLPRKPSPPADRASQQNSSRQPGHGQIAQVQDANVRRLL